MKSPAMPREVTEGTPHSTMSRVTYLRLANLPVGLVINFNVDKLVKGVKRVINPRWDEGRPAAVRLAP